MVSKDNSSNSNGGGGEFTLPSDMFANLPGMEEAARKLYDAGATSPDVPSPNMRLVAKNEAQDVITEADIAETVRQVKSICSAAGVPESEIAKIIAELNSNIGASKSSLGEIKKEALKNAEAVAQEATADKAETPEAKVERLWGEIKGWNQKINDKFDELKAKGAIFDEDDEKKREELKKRAAEGDIEAQKQLQELEKQMLEKLRKTQPELATEISEVEKLLKQREEVFKAYIKAAEDLGKTAKEIEMDKKKFAADTEELKTKEDVFTIQKDIEHFGKQRENIQSAKSAASALNTELDGTMEVVAHPKNAKLQVADASFADSKIAAITPAKPTSSEIIRG